MRKPFGKLFMKTYEQAFNLYVKGQWDDAHEEFEQVLEMRANDPLSTNLIKFMEKTDFEPPQDWKGYKYFQE